MILNFYRWIKSMFELPPETDYPFNDKQSFKSLKETLKETGFLEIDQYGWGPDFPLFIGEQPSIKDDYGFDNSFNQFNNDVSQEEEEMTMTLEEKVKETVDVLCDDLESFTSLDISNRVKEDGFPEVRHREVSDIVRQLHFRDNYFANQHSYEKSNIVVRLSNGQNAMAFLYHHETIDSNDYNNRSLTAVRPEQNDSQPVADGSAVVSNAPVAPVRPSLTDAVANSSRRRTVFDVSRGAASQGVATGRRPRSGIADTPSDAPVQSTGSLTGAVRDSTTRTQKADCRLEIPPTWVATLGWVFGDAVVAYQDTQGVRLEKRGPTAPPNSTCLDIMLVNRDGRLRLTKTALDLSNNVRHGPGVNLTVALLDNCILVS